MGKLQIKFFSRHVDVFVTYTVGRACHDEKVSMTWVAKFIEFKGAKSSF